MHQQHACANQKTPDSVLPLLHHATQKEVCAVLRIKAVPQGTMSETLTGATPAALTSQLALWSVLVSTYILSSTFTVSCSIHRGTGATSGFCCHFLSSHFTLNKLQNSHYQLVSDACLIAGHIITGCFCKSRGRNFNKIRISFFFSFFFLFVWHAVKIWLKHSIITISVPKAPNHISTQKAVFNSLVNIKVGQ